MSVLKFFIFLSKFSFSRLSSLIRMCCWTYRRRRSRSRTSRNQHSLDEELLEDIKSPQESRTMLMSNSEAVHNLYGEISTIRDGDLTHQCIQTNLADVICGGNPNDKILYPRSSKRRSASFPTPRSLERRHSLRLFGSSKRLQRCQSTRSLSKNSTLQQQQQQQQSSTATMPANSVTDSSSSEYHSTDSSSPSEYHWNGILTFLSFFSCSSSSSHRKKCLFTLKNFPSKLPKSKQKDWNLFSSISSSWVV